MAKARKKVMIIGWDGATPEVFDWAKQGKLPALANLLQAGVRGTLTSTVPSHSGVAWPAFVTGKNPGKTGFFGWKRHVPSTYSNMQLSSNKLRPISPIWDILGTHNKKSMVICVPMTYPPYPINGVMVSGVPANVSLDFAYPPEIADKLRSSGFQILVHKEESIKQINKVTWKQAEAVFHFMDSYEWDFFLINFQAHQHWIERGMVFSQCRELDRILAEIRKRLSSDDTLIVMSDHGTIPVHKDVHIKSFLHKNGFMHLKTPRLPLKENFKNLARSLLGRQQGIRKETMMEVDWGRTKAFAVEADSIYINLQGREGKGSVHSDDYIKVCDAISRLLYELEDHETREKVIEKVYRRKDEYWGLFAESAPDVVFQTKKGYRLSATFGPNSAIVSDTQRKTFQDRTGILVVSAPAVKKNFVLENARIFDVIPTVLHMLGFDIPDDMDGRVLSEMFVKNSRLAKRSISYRKVNHEKEDPYKGSGLSFNDEKTLIERLRVLGYLQE